MSEGIKTEKIKCECLRLFCSNGITYQAGKNYLIDEATWKDSETSIPKAFKKISKDSVVVEPEIPQARIIDKAILRKNCQEIESILKAMKVSYDPFWKNNI